MMVDRGAVPTAVAAMRAGSLEVVEKPMRTARAVVSAQPSVNEETNGSSTNAASTNAFGVFRVFLSCSDQCAEQPTFLKAAPISIAVRRPQV